MITETFILAEINALDPVKNFRCNRNFVIIANRCRLGEAVVKGAIRVADVNGMICLAGAP